jgi:hypothetical protein
LAILNTGKIDEPGKTLCDKGSTAVYIEITKDLYSTDEAKTLIYKKGTKLHAKPHVADVLIWRKEAREVRDPGTPPQTQQPSVYASTPQWSIEDNGGGPRLVLRKGRETHWCIAPVGADYCASQGWPEIPQEILSRWKRRVTPEQQAEANAREKEKAVDAYYVNKGFSSRL